MTQKGILGEIASLTWIQIPGPLNYWYSAVYGK